MAAFSKHRWNIDEVKNGDAFRYYFNTNIETKPVVEKWSASKYHFVVPEYHKQSADAADSDKVSAKQDANLSLKEDTLEGDATSSADENNNNNSGSKGKDGRIDSFMEQLKMRQ